MKQSFYLFGFIILLSFSILILFSIFSDELIIQSIGDWFLERIFLIFLFLMSIIGLVYLAPKSNIFENVDSDL